MVSFESRPYDSYDWRMYLDFSFQRPVHLCDQSGCHCHCVASSTLCISSLVNRMHDLQARCFKE